MGMATTDINYLSTFVDYGVITLWDGVLYPLALIIAMLLISWKLTIFALILFPIFVYFLSLIDKKLLPYIKKSQDSFYSLNEKSLEDVSSVKVIRAFGVEENFKENFNNKVRENAKAEMDRYRINLLYLPLVNFACLFFLSFLSS